MREFLRGLRGGRGGLRAVLCVALLALSLRLERVRRLLVLEAITKAGSAGLPAWEIAKLRGIGRGGAAGVLQELERANQIAKDPTGRYRATEGKL